METKQVMERWEDYFEREVAGITGLEAAAINELRDDIAVESSLFELTDIGDEAKNAQTIELIKRRLAHIRQSNALAQDVVSKLAQGRKALSANVSFPVSDAGALPDVDEPLQRFTDLMVELRQHGDYQRIREEYCQLSILLNRQGLLAPAFRPKLNTGKKWDDPVFNAIHRDQLVIDCHWLYATKQTVTVRDRDAEVMPMFRPTKPFPFDLAWRFANEKWKADHRVIDMLRLTPFQQCQLIALRSEEVKQKIERVEHGSRKQIEHGSEKKGVFIPAPLSVFEQGLNAWCERDRRIYKHREGYVAVWKARMFLGDVATVRQIGELAALMTGTSPRDDKTIRSREQNIFRHILGVS